MADAAVAAELIKPRPEAGPLELSSAQASPLPRHPAVKCMVSAEVHCRRELTVPASLQAGCLLLYTVCLTLWVYAEWLTYRRRCAQPCVQLRATSPESLTLPQSGPLPNTNFCQTNSRLDVCCSAVLLPVAV